MKAFFAEFFGSLMLACAVVGSGLMAANLTSDTGLRLLINALATSLMLIVLILVFIESSGAQFNPAVTVSLAIRKKISINSTIQYLTAQLTGMIIGVILSNLMFERPMIEISTQIRDESNLFISEIIATAGLIIIIHLLIEQNRKTFIPFSVAAWIGSAYFFTASTAFANPAITLARTLTNSFSGISPESLMNFLLAQIIGAGLGVLFVLVFNKSEVR